MFYMCLQKYIFIFLESKCCDGSFLLRNCQFVHILFLGNYIGKKGNLLPRTIMLHCTHITQWNLLCSI